jgi:AAA family ATPase
VEIEQLSECVERVNRQLDDQWRQIAGCVPILLHGATGTGKSAILTQLAERAGWKNSLRLNHSDLSVSASKVKTIVANAFAEAVRSQPSLIILDDLHATAGRSEENVVARNVLFESIQDLRGSKVQVVAAARRPIDVDQKLLACFREKIELPTPTPTSRLKILSHFSHALSDEVTLKWVAEKTHAYTATDLDNLCFAALRAAETRGSRYHKSLTNGDHGEGHRSVLVKADLYTPPTITLDDFHQALRFVHPSLIDDLYIEVPKVYWSDIAGSSEVKQKLYEAAELPLKHPEVLAQLQMHVNHGILLYGPPGCSKTMTAKALATESGLNFIAVKGPELVSKYVGESEYKIREIFRKARAASPSVIFFDEIDSIAPNREGGGGHEGLNTVATLLNEMDGVEDVQRVLVLAATNRPDAIDPALLRPGRLGTSLYVGPPNYDAVLEILKTRTSRMGGKKSMLHLASTAAQMVENGCFSGADVGAVCDAAGMLCAVEAVKQGTPIDDIAVRQEHLDQALASAKPSLSKRQLAFLQKWSVGQSESGE